MSTDPKELCKHCSRPSKNPYLLASKRAPVEHPHKLKEMNFIDCVYVTAFCQIIKVKFDPILMNIYWVMNMEKQTIESNADSVEWPSL